MTDLERLQTLLQSSAPCVWIVTDEEEEAVQLVRDAAMALSRPMLQWSIISGLHDGLVSPSEGQKDTDHPAAALFALCQNQEPTLCLMLDLIAHLSDERTLRAARDLLEKYEGDGSSRLILIDHRDDLPPVLRSQASRFEISAPDMDEIEKLVISTLRRVHRSRPITMDISRSELKMIEQNLRGLTRRQIEQVITEAAWRDQRFCAGDLPTILERKRDLLRSEGLLEYVEAPTDMGQIGGLGRLKKWLAQREGALTDEARQFGLKAPRGVLMLGVQGAGKSLCAKAIATAWKRPLLRLDPSVLFDRFIGESERRLRDALRQAEMMAPVVLWIDEIEKGFASAASRSIDGGLSQRMFGTLLTWMQEHTPPVFLAATANDIEALPPELLRKGRFDEIFFVDLPTPEARDAIFRIHLKKRGRDPAKFDLPALVKATEGYSGAEIEQGIIGALHDAFSSKADLSTPKILMALKESPPLSVTMAESVQQLRQWAKDRCAPAD